MIPVKVFTDALAARAEQYRQRKLEQEADLAAIRMRVDEENARYLRDIVGEEEVYLTDEQLRAMDKGVQASMKIIG